MNPIILDSSPLVLTEENKGQLVCGLSWDPNEDTTAGDKLNSALGRNTETYDLDLSCYCYDEHKSMMDFVTGEDGEHIDRSENIFHSGDCRHGEAEGDDEAITFDPTALPDYIQHIVFLAEVGSAHAFYNVSNPYIRMADKASDQILMDLNIKSPDEKDYSACVFATLSRQKNGTWLLHRNNYYLDHEQIENWGDFLSQFIAA
jgi:stress response protein SCP2